MPMLGQLCGPSEVDLDYSSTYPHHFFRLSFCRVAACFRSWLQHLGICWLSPGRHCSLTKRTQGLRPYFPHPEPSGRHRTS